MENASVQARAALASRLESLLGRPGLGPEGRAARLEQNLVNCMTVGQMRAATAEIEQGDGRELHPGADGLPPPLHSAYSSAALAVNAFACWRGSEGELELAGVRGFTSLAFERKFRIFARGTPPNLDVVLEAPDHAVAVESKCTEHLAPKAALFAGAYNNPELRADMDDSWRALLRSLQTEPERYGLLDAAQLVKHYLGLKRQLRKPFTLVYLYWEPENADAHPVFRAHREALARFSDAVGDSPSTFVPLSYPELWETWAARRSPAWLAEHVAQLRRRYAVAL